ncbi:hypothetical protein J2Z40_004026, partial [Cytobacillus eiseniae]|nr:hypothetical protein [Cytobacillus eiseniae]
FLLCGILKISKPNNLPLEQFWKVLVYLDSFAIYTISWKVELLFKSA